MNIRVSEQGSSKVAIVESDEVIIRTVQDALDLMATVSYLHTCNKMVVAEGAITPEFFDLKTKLAGDILQKYTNYQMKLAIVGDFKAASTSKSLHDFIYESNKGSQIFFLPDERTAVNRLHELL